MDCMGNGLYGNCIQLLVHGDEDYWVLYELTLLLKIHDCLLLLEMHISSNTITKRTASQSTHDIAVLVCLETGMILFPIRLVFIWQGWGATAPVAAAARR